MTRKDYQVFANLLAGENAMAKHNNSNASAIAVLHNLMLSIADIFANDSPQFDRQRFYEACMKGEKYHEPRE